MDLKAVADFLATIPVTEAGARHSASDKALLQTIHDHALSLGASCPMGESHRGTPSDVRLVESSICDVVRFRESAGPNPLVKIISPGRGSSGYYSKELLQRDLGIFKKGTLMFANHATQAEEAARPEGDWEKLVAVTSGNAYWDENGKDGPAVYAPVLPMASRAKELAEKAPYTGVSIRASGRRDEKAIGPDGLPGVITALTGIESVDVVTKAGRDGKLLLESASAEINLEEAAMDAAELKKLQESHDSLKASSDKLLESNRKMAQRLARSEARDIVREKLATVRLPDPMKTRLLERICVVAPITVDGDLDATGLNTLIEARIKEAGEDLKDLTGDNLVVGMGGGAAEMTEAERAAAHKDSESVLVETAGRFGWSDRRKAGLKIFNEGRGTFDPTYNARDKEVA